MASADPEPAPEPRGGERRPELESLGADVAKAGIARRLFGRESAPVKVGRFSVLESLGAGAMGSVYAAYDPDLDRKVALKLLRAQGAGERLRAEAQALARLTHPNVVAVYEVGEHEGRGYLAMEYVRGASLDVWLAGSPSQERILDAFVQAGRGLAAAHDAGLIHRDFKPANVMVGEDGRVRVTDFGLATRTRTAEGGPVGTPAYMAPEQRDGAGVDARADQWSFCAALAEALGTRLPEPGDSIPLAESIPANVRRVLTRGLTADPGGRWPSMTALVDALRPRSSPALRALLVSASLLTVIGAAALTTDEVASPPATDPCAGANVGFEEIWSADRAASVRAAFERTGSALADGAARRAQTSLDQWAHAWGEARDDACRDTRERAQQSGEGMDLRYACLDRLRVQVDAMLRTFESADVETVLRAGRALESLPGVATCGDVARLRARGTPVPADQEEHVATLRRQLADARAQYAAGQYQEAESTLAAAVAQLTDSTHAPTRAEMLIVDGRVAVARGAPDRGVAQTREAYWIATRAGADELAADAATMQVFALSEARASAERVDEWANHARASVARLGGDRLRDAELSNHIGIAYAVLGRSERATAEFERALAHWDDGGRYPIATARLSTNLAAELEVIGRRDEARAHLERALTLWTAHVGPKHPYTGRAMTVLGDLELSAGAAETALELHQRAREISVETAGATAPATARMWIHTCNDLRVMKRYDDAIADCERGVAMLEDQLEPHDPQLAYPLTHLANVFLDAGRPRAAYDLYVRVQGIDEAELGPDHAWLGFDFTGQAHALLALGEAADAVQTYEKAIAAYARGPIDPLDQAEAEFGLAKALRAAGRDPVRSVELARRALATYQSHGHDQVDAVQAFLDAE